MRSDEGNLLLADNPEAVDSANRQFYARFPYPRPPIAFPRLADPGFETVMLNQSIGDFAHGTIPPDASIWIAGCGTNQAVYTALGFSQATVIASDLSPAALEASRTTAAALGIDNLVLRQESLNHVTYHEEFDYVLSTGVIHHNADPARTLSKIARALRPGGVLELMVYNRFHRIFNTAFEKAVRTIARYAGRESTFEEELDIAKALASTEPIASSAYLAPFRYAHESHLADALIQPVEYTYTVESLDALVAECGLELMLPCYNQFDRAADRLWTIAVNTSGIQQRIDALPDVVRWQIANLLLLEQSPMLWFYVRHRRESSDGRYEVAVNERFLNQTFVSASTTLRNYVRETNQSYALSPEAVSYPLRHQSPLVRDVVDRADGRLTMRDILRDLDLDTGHHKAVTDIRVQTTTSLCPHLKAA